MGNYTDFDFPFSVEKLSKKFGRPKLLHVDDNPKNLKVLVDMLKNESYIQYFVGSGEEAILEAKRHLPDLILMDVNMPGMDGFETFKRLQEDEKTKSIPIIFLTAEAGLDNAIKGLEMGSIDYIRKPFEFNELKMKIRNHIKIRLYQKSITESYSDISGLIENINQSVFCINGDGTILGPVSAYSSIIFECNIEGSDIFDTVFSFDSDALGRKEEILENLKECFNGSKGTWFNLIRKFPQKIIFKNSENIEKILNVKYVPIWDKELLTKIMITIQDITLEEQFSKKEKNYSLAQASELTGLKQNTIKTWVHRYDMTSRNKDKNGNHIFSEEECERIKVYGLLIQKGSKVSNLIKLSDKELKVLHSKLSMNEESMWKNSSDSSEEILKSLMFFVKEKKFKIFFHELKKVNDLFEQKYTINKVYFPLYESVKSEEYLTKIEKQVCDHYFSEVLKKFFYSKKEANASKADLKVLLFSFNSESSPLFWMMGLFALCFKFEVTILEKLLYDKEYLVKELSPDIICCFSPNDKENLNNWLKSPLINNFSKEKDIILYGSSTGLLKAGSFKKVKVLNDFNGLDETFRAIKKNKTF